MTAVALAWAAFFAVRAFALAAPREPVALTEQPIEQGSGNSARTRAPGPAPAATPTPGPGPAPSATSTPAPTRTPTEAPWHLFTRVGGVPTQVSRTGSGPATGRILTGRLPAEALYRLLHELEVSGQVVTAFGVIAAESAGGDNEEAGMLFIDVELQDAR